MESSTESNAEAWPAEQVVRRRWCFKTVVLGDSGVGKTWLVESALTSQMSGPDADATEQREPLPNLQRQVQQQQQLDRRGEGDTEESGTIGVTFNLTKLEMDGSIVLLQVWDTSGKDRYRGLLQNYLTDLSCVIIAYNPCCDSAEACCRSLAKWHQFVLESSGQTETKAVSGTSPATFCVVAIGGDGGGCGRPHACDHVRGLAAGRVFAETLHGRFFHCRRVANEGGDGSRCEWISGSQALTAQWLGRELLRRHFNYLARLLAEEDSESCGAEAMKGTRSCCQRLARRLQALASWPALAAFLFGRQLLPRT